MSDTIGGRVTGLEAEGPVTMPEGTGERASEQSFSAQEMSETLPCGPEVSQRGLT